MIANHLRLNRNPSRSLTAETMTHLLTDLSTRHEPTVTPNVTTEHLRSTARGPSNTNQGLISLAVPTLGRDETVNHGSTDELLGVPNEPDLEKNSHHAQYSSNLLPRSVLGGYRGNFLTKNSNYQLFHFPHSFKEPANLSHIKGDYYHRDALGRQLYSDRFDDRYINPETGCLEELVVQCTDDVYYGPRTATYKRTFIRNGAPKTLRLANWPINHFDDRRRGQSHWSYLQEQSGYSVALMLLKWPLACLILYAIVWLPDISGTGEVHHDGDYDPFPYKFWGYCKVTRNPIEEKPKKNKLQEVTRKPIEDKPEKIKLQEVSLESINAAPKHCQQYRCLEPRKLCIITGRKHHATGEEFAEAKITEQWKKDPQNTDYPRQCPPYLFIAYTCEHFKSKDDKKELNRIALRATKKAGLKAYWIGSSCLASTKPEDKEELEADVQRIADVVRGAHSMAIVIGTLSEATEETSLLPMLQAWGMRCWTFPEVLLAPSGKSITTYFRDSTEVFNLSKLQLAEKAWGDSVNARQLIDHFEGNVILSRLELPIIAMQCLFTRKTTQMFEGDQSYVLMGLLRMRPRVDPDDSAFQAFARISLANDSDLLLERLLCILPKRHDQKWHCMDDAYEAHLWDINPTCQVAGICEDDSVLVDGAFGATIHWGKFQKVASVEQGRSWRRFVCQFMVHAAPLYMSCALFLFTNATMLAGEADNASTSKEWKNWSRLADLLVVLGIMVLVVAGIVFATLPYLIRLLYGGKFWDTQAWLFGFEGYADLATIETQIFGRQLNRLQWATNATPLSKHCCVSYEECEGVDPISHSEVRKKVDHAIRGGSEGGMRIFTLVDTNTMSVMMFEAIKPPTSMLILGREGGMQRALLCSYDWTMGKCIRETVARVETTVLEKMSRVAKVRIGMRQQ
ncbi:hypothetical protein ACMFMG_006710 [Clarireedia jacksonii]